MSFVPVDLDEDVVVTDVLWRYRAAVAAGYVRHQDGTEVPFLASVTPDGRSTSVLLPGPARLRSAWCVSDEVCATTTADPWACFVWSPESGLFRAEVPQVSAAKALWTVCGSEDDALVAEWERGRLTVHEPGTASEALPEGQRLFRVGPRAELLVGQPETGGCVAGLLRGGNERTPTLSWWIHDYFEGWSKVALPVAMAGFTHLHSGLWPVLCGHHAGHPVLVSEDGDRLPAPPVELDPDHPMVIAPGFAPEKHSVVVQSAADGGEVWTLDNGWWTGRPLPPGRVDAAERPTETNELWVVVDGRLWREITD